MHMDCGYDDKAVYICLEPSFHAAVSCGDAPPAPANGSRIGSGNTFGSTVTYTCNHGYSPSAQGPNKITLTCMANGRWSGSTPQCYGKRVVTGNIHTLSSVLAKAWFTLKLFHLNTKEFAPDSVPYLQRLHKTNLRFNSR